MHYLPELSVVIPITFGLLIGIFSRTNVKFQKTLFVGGSFLTFLVLLGMFSYIKVGTTLGTGAVHLSSPLSFSLAVDNLSFFMAAIFAFVFLMISVYSLGYADHGHGRGRYYALLLITKGAMIGLVLSTSLLGLFIFFEIMSVSAYLLVIHEEDETAMFAGAKFLYMAIIAGLAIFFGLVVTLYQGGRVDYVPGGYMTVNALSTAALFAFLAGFGLKAGMFPLHIWLPDAHPAAPAPVSAMLSGLSIKTGIYGLIRVMHDVYGLDFIRHVSFDKVLMVLAVITILLGSALALQHDQLKRRLAYSSVAQIGYVLLGISLLTERAMFGALFHIFSHALMKGTLFLCAGAIITQTGKKYISQMKGIGYEMPVVMLCFALASVTMVGIPPFNAFISKWHLALASLETGRVSLVAVLMVSSLLNALYYFPVVINAFFIDNLKAGKATLIRDEIPLSMLWTTALMAILCVGFAFTRPHWPVELASRIAGAFF